MTDLRTIAARLEHEAWLLGFARRTGNRAARIESRREIERIYAELTGTGAEVIELQFYQSSRRK